MNGHHRGDPCSADECGKPAIGRGLCSRHYARWHRHGDPLWVRPVREIVQRPAYVRLEHRIDDQIDKSAGPDGCWPWQGALAGIGYGHLYAVIDGKRVQAYAHRAVYIREYGPIPDSQILVRRPDCTLTNCCNPGHWRAADWKEMARSRAERQHWAPRAKIHPADVLTEEAIDKLSRSRSLLERLTEFTRIKVAS